LNSNYVLPPNRTSVGNRHEGPSHNVVFFAKCVKCVTELLSHICLTWLQYARVFCMLSYSLGQNLLLPVCLYIYIFSFQIYTSVLVADVFLVCMAHDVRIPAPRSYGKFSVMWTSVYDITERTGVTSEDYGIVLVQGIH